jgi:hypothetical protein
MGKETEKMLDEFDAEQDKKEVQKRIAPKTADAGVTRSGRKKHVFRGG